MGMRCGMAVWVHGGIEYGIAAAILAGDPE